MKTLKVRNTRENRDHLNYLGRTFKEDGFKLIVDLTDHEAAMAHDAPKLKRHLGL